MLTIIGTGHVFDIADPIAFITKHSWPNAVCVELDRLRYDAITGNREAVEEALTESGEEVSPMYKRSAEYQRRISSDNDVQPGADMAAAIAVAEELKAEVFCIDRDAREAMARMWREMSRKERLRYRLSQFSDRVGGSRKVVRTQKRYSGNEEAYLMSMRRRYPTLVRVLIDERNEHMAGEISRVCQTHERVVAVMGDGHVGGIVTLLPEIDKRVVRLADLTDPERLKRVKGQIWDGERDEGNPARLHARRRQDMRRGRPLMLLGEGRLRDDGKHRTGEGAATRDSDGAPIGRRTRRVHVLRGRRLSLSHPSAREAPHRIFLAAEPALRLYGGRGFCDPTHR